MTDKKPTEEVRRRSLDENKKGYREHLIQQGKIPNSREIDKLHNGIAEKVDREKGW